MPFFFSIKPSTRENNKKEVSLPFLNPSLPLGLPSRPPCKTGPPAGFVELFFLSALSRYNWHAALRSIGLQHSDLCIGRSDCCSQSP